MLTVGGTPPRILALGSGPSAPKGETVPLEDFGEVLLAPGLVNVHLHLADAHLNGRLRGGAGSSASRETPRPITLRRVLSPTGTTARLRATPARTPGGTCGARRTGWRCCWRRSRAGSASPPRRPGTWSGSHPMPISTPGSSFPISCGRKKMPPERTWQRSWRPSPRGTTSPPGTRTGTGATTN